MIFTTKTQKRLLSEANLTLSKAVKIARSIEVVEAQITQLQSTNSVPVMKVTQTPTMPRRPLPETLGSVHVVEEVTIRLKNVVIGIQNVISAIRLDTCRVCVEQ